jgi:SARP family transcriptional regulator, regulator of embCAB operon
LVRRLRYLILGPIEVRDGETVIALRGGQQRKLLAILLLQSGAAVSRDRLIDELWHGKPPHTAAKALQGYISSLRKQLGQEAVETVGPGYRLPAATEQVDARRFEELLAEARSLDQGAAVTKLREALALWRGPALADFAYDDFANHEIDRLEELRLTGVERRIDLELTLGCHDDLVPELEALVRAHPLREHLRAQYMLALYRAGRQADALEAYQQAREALVDELGIEPGPALQRLQREILIQDQALEPPTRVAAPSGIAPRADDTSFPSTRLVLAEDNYLLREGMRRLLETNPDLEVAAVCEDLDSLLAAAEAERPDVVVTDIRMPPGNLDEGIRASDRLRREHPGVGVVVLSQYLEPAYALALFEAGTERRAYLLKERVRDVGQLVAAIRAVAEGGSVVDPKVVEALVAEKTRREHSPLDELTPRERDVLREMAEGKNNAGIAEALRLSERTVEKVIHAIFLKLGLAWETTVHRRVKAVILYLSGTDAETRPAERSS